ncbi:heat shock 70 kDa protein 12B-like [Saccostrea echinata]|uniref:heat shock 70 kDa protein 12B-like n=1 Tax=Saccostrea echinata TaxID=191078 RepID=UPI002A82054E|nr:heat shock 70 kDa protein 12B-like [Saccostrea echinata]
MAGGASSLDGKLLVVALDFGTAYSGYAFSFRSDYRLDPLKIEINHWTGEGAQTMSPKAPSSVLLNPDKTFHSFGYKAEEEYASLVENEEHQDWYFFTNIKMRLLYKEKVSRSDSIEDECGKSVQGLTILSMLIRHLKYDLYGRLNMRGINVRDQDILWVLTVPAIWSDAAKQFTREAAEQAGIKAVDMIFVYEPEAAALYCRLQKLHMINDATDSPDSDSKTTLTERKILVFDMGGGTTDISVMDIKSDKEIHIVEQASGGPFGGTAINERFSNWMSEIFGEENMKAFKTNKRSDYMQLIRDFEQKKRPIDPKEDKPLCLQIPPSLKKLAEKTWNCNLEDHFKNLESFPDVQVKKRGKLFLSSSFLLENFVLPIANNVLAEMERILAKHGDINCVIAVGGIAQSAAMTTEIRKYAKNIPVYVPFDSSVAVLNGAVLYGHENNVIKARVCRYSYGIQTMRPFTEGKDDESKKVIQEGEIWCKHCFRSLYNAGDMIKLGDVRPYELEESFHDEDRKNKRFQPIRCVLFRSEKKHPRYVTEEGCFETGRIEIEPPEEGFPIHYECIVELEFAGTEIIARLKDSERIKTIRLDFLS